MKLNNAEERARFEAAFIANRAQYAKDNGINVERQIANVKKSLEKGLVPAALFEMWIAAKEDAIEQAKPKATVFEKAFNETSWWWIRCNGVVMGSYPTSEKAIETAEGANMKVVAVLGFDPGQRVEVKPQ